MVHNTTSPANALNVSPNVTKEGNETPSTAKHNNARSAPTGQHINVVTIAAITVICEMEPNSRRIVFCRPSRAHQYPVPKAVRRARVAALIAGPIPAVDYPLFG